MSLQELESIDIAISKYVKRCLMENAIPTDADNNNYIHEALRESGAVEAIDDKRKCEWVMSLFLWKTILILSNADEIKNEGC